jgi:hypothetical protein
MKRLDTGFTTVLLVLAAVGMGARGAAHAPSVAQAALAVPPPPGIPSPPGGTHGPVMDSPRGQGPCTDKCLADYTTDIAQCDKLEESSARDSCRSIAYARLTRCQESCQQNDCDDKYQDCVNNGPKSCLKEEGGKTLCNRCWERCNAGDSPSARCRKCKF